MKNIIFILLYLLSFNLSAQYDFTQCSVNITNNDIVEVGVVEGYNNIVLLQSGTELTINYFIGEITFVHGLKALEERPDFVKPILIINKCHKKSRINIDLENIYYLPDKSCSKKRTNSSTLTIN